MIPQSKIIEIQNLLEKSENPFFYFDNDCDGLCSFILLYKKYKKGHFALSKAILEEEHFLRKVKEYSPDLIVLLDIAKVPADIKEKVNLPIMLIDHHPLQKINGVYSYNLKEYNHDEQGSTTAIAYEIVNSNLWWAILGAISDWHIPKYKEEFSKLYPDILPKEINSAGEANFETNLGKIIRVVNFCLRGKASEVRRNINILLKVESPYEILNQTTPRGKYLNKKVEKIEKEYNALLEKAIKKVDDDKILLFEYKEKKTSLSALLSNELTHEFPDKLIIVAREKQKSYVLSLRSSESSAILVSKILERALVGIDGFGGGHNHACGATISKNDFERFIKNVGDEL